MQPRGKRNWDQYSNPREIPQNPYGTAAKAKLSGKRDGELYQLSLQENQRIQDQEQKKTDQQSSNKLPSQELSEELRGILQTRKKILETSLSPQELSNIGNGILRSELHSNGDKLINLRKEIKCHLDEEREYYNALVIEDNNTKNEIQQLKAEKKRAESPKGPLKDLAEACRKYSFSQGAMINDLQQQIGIAERFASMGFKNSIPIENLKNMQKDIVESRKRTIEEGQNSLKEWEKSREIIGEIENNLKEAKKLEIKHIHHLRESERNIRIYTNLARLLETIPNSNLQPEKQGIDSTHLYDTTEEFTQNDMILEIDNSQSIEKMVKGHMQEKIKMERQGTNSLIDPNPRELKGEKKVQPEIKLVDIRKTIQSYTSANSKKNGTYNSAINYMKNLRDKLKTGEGIDIDTLCDDKVSSGDDKIRTAINYLFYTVEERTGHRPFKQATPSSLESNQEIISPPIEEQGTDSAINPEFEHGQEKFGALSKEKMHQSSNKQKEVSRESNRESTSSSTKIQDISKEEWNTMIKSYKNTIPTDISGIRPPDMLKGDEYILGRINTLGSEYIGMNFCLQKLKKEFNNKNQNKYTQYTKLCSANSKLSSHINNKNYKGGESELIEAAKHLYTTINKFQDQIIADDESVGHNKIKPYIKRFLDHFDGISQ